MINLLNNLPALLVVLPMLSSFIILLLANKAVARNLFVITNLMMVFLSLTLLQNYTETNYYVFGDWVRPVGIEFKIDGTSIYSVLILSVFCTLFGIFCFSSLKKNVETLMKSGREHIVYALFLFVETGYSGILLTNDVFNLYVFLELASLATYPLIAISNDRKSLVSAFEYLVIGTLSATFILISIGIILSLVGSLNLSDIKYYFQVNQGNAKYILAFLIVGILVKIASFPLHSWKIKSYSTTSPIILCFFINISVLCAIVILLKFSYIINLISGKALFYINLIGYTSVIFSSIMVIREKNFRNIIIYSSIASAGYYLILYPFDGAKVTSLLTKLFIVDSFTKLGLVLFLISINKENITVDNLVGFAKNNKYLASTFVIILFFAAALPPSQAFFNKLSFFKEVGSDIKLVILLALCSFLFVLTYSRIVMKLFRESEIEVNYLINNNAANGMRIVAVVLISLLFISNNFDGAGHLIASGNGR